MDESLTILYWWDYLAITLIVFFGLPHGAFDSAVGISIGFYNDTVCGASGVPLGVPGGPWGGFGVIV